MRLPPQTTDHSGLELIATIKQIWTFQSTYPKYYSLEELADLVAMLARLTDLGAERSDKQASGSIPKIYRRGSSM